MKKLFLFAAAAAMMTACSETEVLDQTAYQQNADQVGGIKFDVYAQRGITRGGGQYGDLNNANIGKNGFGVFAYYTAGEQYSNSAKPNFMYNQQVTCDGDATEATIWKYEPVKYWPNEYGSAAVSDDIDYLTFFAYAPWTEFEPTTGELIVPATLTDKDSIEHYQKYNIISVNKNTATGDPIIKYVVDTDPATSVDLLWGVAAEEGEKPYYTPIDGEDANKDVAVEPGMPFIDLVKPNDPVNDKILFNLRHSLAKVRVSIDYVADQLTPADYDAEVKSDSINANETRIFVRSFSIEGWATEGALNLNNTEADKPLWKDVDGVKDINFSKITYFDGLKDGKEGTENNAQKSESPIGLNGQIIENYAKPDTIWTIIEEVKWTAEDAAAYNRENDYHEGDEGYVKEGDIKVAKDSLIAGFKFAEGKNPGVGAATPEPVDAIEIVDGGCVQGATGKAAVGSVLLFGGDPANNGGYFYVIPRNQEEGVNVAISYDVETIDKNLADKLSDNLLKGSSIENNIYKENIFGAGIDFEPGKVYDIKIHLGMTSVKIDATVTAWEDGKNAVVNLPSNPDVEEEP